LLLAPPYHADSTYSPWPHPRPCHPAPCPHAETHLPSHLPFHNAKDDTADLPPPPLAYTADLPLLPWHTRQTCRPLPWHACLAHSCSSSRLIAPAQHHLPFQHTQPCHQPPCAPGASLRSHSPPPPRQAGFPSSDSPLLRRARLPQTTQFLGITCLQPSSSWRKAPISRFHRRCAPKRHPSVFR
jgi:hypothetical protein